VRAGADGTSLTAAERVAWLRLIRTDNVGPQTFWQLLRREGSAEAALAALPHLTRRIAAAPRIPSRAEAEDEIAGLEALGGRLVASVEADYPALLKYISGAPPLLALAGRTRPDLQRTVGIVGARNASTAGQKLTRQLATELGEAGYVVVSGLARGIDAAAHRASLAGRPHRVEQRATGGAEGVSNSRRVLPGCAGSSGKWHFLANTHRPSSSRSSRGPRPGATSVAQSCVLRRSAWVLGLRLRAPRMTAGGGPVDSATALHHVAPRSLPLPESGRP